MNKEEKIVREAVKLIIVQCVPCTKELPLGDGSKAQMVYKKEEDPIVGGDIHTYACKRCGNKVDMFVPVQEG